MDKDNIIAALQQDRFYCVFQPIIDCRSGNPHSHEVLARLRSDVPASPLEFFAIAEQYSIGHLITLHTVEKALEICSHQPIALNVNLSPNQLCHPDTLDDLEKLLEHYSYPQHLVTIELTEAKCDLGWECLKECVGRYAAAGFKISLDDFGVQNQTIQRLLELPITQVKLDKYLLPIRHENMKKGSACDDRYNKKLMFLQAILRIANASNIEVICEGIEDQATANVLEEVGVHLHQGYYYVKPQNLPFAPRPIVSVQIA